MCAIVTIMIDRAVHISVAVDMRTLSDRNHFSSSSNGQVAAHRVTGLIIKRLWFYLPMFLQATIRQWKDVCARPTSSSARTASVCRRKWSVIVMTTAGMRPTKEDVVRIPDLPIYFTWID